MSIFTNPIIEAMAENKENKEKVRYSDEELQEFKEMILEKVAKAKEEYATL